MEGANKRKVLFVSPSMGGGGAERVAVTLLEYINRERFELTLALVEKKGPYLDEVPRYVTVVDLECRHVRHVAWRLLKTIHMRRPDVVFSSQGHLNLVIAFLRRFAPCSTRFVARETNIASLVNMQGRYGWLFPILYRRYYGRFDRVICQSRDMRDDLMRIARVDEDRLEVIHNPVNYSYITKKASERTQCFSGTKMNVLAAGKFTRQKGFDLLLRAFSKVKAPKCSLTILGRGPEEMKLRQQAVSLGIADRVRFPGFKSNPYAFMAQANVFVLSSRFEGLPNVVLEANACGTPVVAFDCLGGIAEIIEDGVNGWKVEPEDTEALAGAISRALDTPIDRWRVKEFITRRFPLEETIRKFEAVFAA